MTDNNVLNFKLTTDVAMNIIKIVSVFVVIFISVGVILELCSPGGRGHDLAVILITTAVSVPNTLLGVLGIGHLQKGNDPANPLYMETTNTNQHPVPVERVNTDTDTAPTPDPTPGTDPSSPDPAAGSGEDGTG